MDRAENKEGGTAPVASETALRLSAWALVACAWVSGVIFGCYILVHFGDALADGALERWNDILRLHNANQPLATFGIGVHLLAGAVLLLLGPLQLLSGVRSAYPAAHRATGRLYVASGMAAGAGGLIHIAMDRTIGGAVMDVGFALYGVLMIVCSTETVRHAMARRLDRHRAFAIRLFALAIGSWLYRLEYGLWEVVAGDLWRTDDFRGGFDRLMAFFFYVPNLVVAEAYIRSSGRTRTVLTKTLTSALLTAATALVVVSTYFFTVYLWAPAIAGALS
jgi:hypothetical protein